MRLAIKLALFAALLFGTDRAVDWVLRRGLDQYWGLDRPAAVLCVGHSRMVLGVDDQKLAQRLGVPVVKYAMNGADASDRYAMIRHYFDLHGDSVKAVVYDVSAFTFSDAGLSANSYRLLYPYLDNPDIAAHIREQAATPDEIFWRRLFRSLRYDEVTLSLAFRGYSGQRGNLKLGHVDVADVASRIAHGETRKMEVDPANVRVFEETLRFVHQHGARVVLVYIPTLDLLSNSNRPAHDRIVALLRQYGEKWDGVTFLNYNDSYESKSELFFDPIHMNAEGQRVVTDRLAGDLGKLLATPPPAHLATPGG